MKNHLKVFFSHFDIAFTSFLWLIGAALVIPDLDRPEIWLAIVVGMGSYSASEYLIHRFLFHLKPPRNPFFLKLLKRLHYDHHMDPNNLKLLFLPVWYSLPLIGIAGGLAYLLTASISLTLAFVSGVITFLLYYEWTHFVAHRPIQPWTPWGKWMKKVHLWHHFKNEHFWFGVTQPFYDVLFGTFKKENEVERSETVRNLEQREGTG
ncbi:fatty acid hydroxylase [Kroppenstedtia guangzhouensis]|jgi:4-hydroxysphinganine ceramide fatty acyl 2-hydroxylase|uniref:Fatty acid hydroxylase n=1 Tax=Kroppenstedtia guangzhouensis TaxID=1274356 RepID=A0ABQ1H1H0_9BACL|nr:sterol desaturase family protein [Kroppenstedtia guangzhouensis]GGA54299.1 fatty acid hydroxylase [Kroppenstedtia guangzhouensis]